MTANPKAAPGGHADPVLVELAELRQALDALGRRTLASASVASANGQILFSITPSGYTDASGNPLVSVTINDPLSGFPLLKQSPATVAGNVGTAWFWQMDDRSGNQVIATDGLSGTGLAYPYIPVPVYPRWNGGPFQTATATGEAAAVASSIVGMGTLWEGRIGFCSHPAISVDGMWGDVDSGTPVITYKLVVGSQNFTWTQAGFSATRHTFDIHTQVGSTDLPVTVAVTSVGTAVGTDRIACGVKGLYLRQTPAVFG